MDSRVIVLTADEKVEDFIDKAYDIVAKAEMLTRTNGYETLEFKIPFNYPKRELLFNERRLEVDGRRYIIKLIDDSKSSSNITTITCDATWYELADGELINHEQSTKFTARQAIDEQLDGTGWTSGIVEIDVPHRFTLHEKNTRLYNLRYIHKVFGGDMWFDTKYKKVNLYSVMGKRTSNIFKYEKNVLDIKRTIDTRNLITRYTLLGKDGANISEINDGIPYLENYGYYDQLGIPRVLKSYEEQDDRFSNTAYMKWYMEQWLAKYAFPEVMYQINPSIISGTVEMGDYIYVIDTQLGLQKWLRILAMEENKNEPWKSKFTLENVYANISDILNDEVSSSGSSSIEPEQHSDTTEDVGGQQFTDMSPFNLLLNSSGDNGLANWDVTGFELDTSGGDSGSNCFRSKSTSGTNTLVQTIHPRTKNNYTISASFECPNGYEYSPQDKVGIEVTINYDDGTSQTEFISFFGEMGEGAE